MPWYSPGYRLLNRISFYTFILGNWTRLEIQNDENYDTGRLALAHADGQQFYLMREFDDDDNEIVEYWETNPWGSPRKS